MDNKEKEINDQYIWFIPGTSKSPTIYFDLENGIFEFKGRFHPENCEGFIKPILDKLDEFDDKYPNKSLNAKFLFEDWFGGSYRQSMTILMEKFKAHYINSYHPEVLVYWYYYGDNFNDDDILERLLDMQSRIKVPFKFIEVEEDNNNIIWIMNSFLYRKND